MLHLSPPVEVALVVASVVMFVGTMVAVPVFLVRIPDDYFARPRATRALPAKILRTAIGVTLIALGLAMIVLPGQGVLTILVGLGILDVPLRERLILRILCVPKVHRAIDNLRHKRGKGSLLLPGSCAAPEPGAA
jgi:hypothetical protein